MRILLGWPIVGAVVALLVIAGAVLIAAGPPRSGAARQAFSLAAVILIARVAGWLLFESRDASALSRLVVGMAILGIAGAWWSGAMKWTRGR